MSKSLRSSGASLVGRGLVSLACLGLSGTACSSGPLETGDVASTPEEEPLEAETTILSEIELGYGILTFSEITLPDGSHMISMMEQAGSHLEETPIDRLFREYGPLTALEVFRAVAAEREPPIALFDHQHADALAFGRPDDAIVEAHFDRVAVVGGEGISTKSRAACVNYVFADPGKSGDWNVGLVALAPGDSVFNTLYAGGWGHFSTEAVTLGICNEGTLDVQGRRCWKEYRKSNPTICEGYLTTPSGWMTRWWNYNILTRCPPPQGEMFCGLIIPANNSVQGTGPAGSSLILAGTTLGPQACTTASQCLTGYNCVNGFCTPNIR
jgi:hypothetical protein